MTMGLARLLSALASGIVFGFGLSLSGMLDPARVRGFLDVFGAWDPSLVFVMGGAVVVMSSGLLLRRLLARPLLDTSFHMPAAKGVDGRLLAGSALFGIGWGLAGFCPGPAVAALSTGLAPVIWFVAAMIAGMVFHDRVVASRRS